MDVDDDKFKSVLAGYSLWLGRGRYRVTEIYDRRGIFSP